MKDKYLRLSQLATTRKNKGMLPASPATVWRWVAADKFPKPFKLNGMTLWDVQVVEAYMRKKQAACCLES